MTSRDVPSELKGQDCPCSSSKAQIKPLRNDPGLRRRVPGTFDLGQ